MVYVEIFTPQLRFFENLCTYFLWKRCNIVIINNYILQNNAKNKQETTMWTYNTTLRDMHFVIEEVLQAPTAWAQTPVFKD